MRIGTCKFLAILVLLAPSAALAHSGHGSTDAAGRTWKNASGNVLTDGEFVLERKGTVLLRRADETLVRVRLDELNDEGKTWVAQRVAAIHTLNQAVQAANDPPDAGSSHGSAGSGEIPIPVRFFESFVPHVSVHWDDRELIVESDGMAEHPMMVGIRAWNQQVPLPQSYRGENAFRIPLHPTEAPESTPAPYLNAIAVAVNGVPIFHPIKQDGRTDTVVNGELDEYGGHAGRGDDYHYHIAPRHLEKIVGAGNPVAYSLDGYPIVVAREENGKPAVPLDANHGHADAEGHYAYYSTTSFPYINISYRGVVDLEHRPRAAGIRPYTQPLRGALITDFEKLDPSHYRLSYTLDGQVHTIAYQTSNDGGAQFKFTDADSASTTETYPGGRENGRKGKRGPGREDQGGGPASRPMASPETPQQPEKKPGQKGPDPSGGPEKTGDGAPRQPWILAHAAELDTDQNGTISVKELSDEVNRAFDGYDTNRDGTLSTEELGTRSNVRSAMGGFIKGHAKEVDQNSDTGLTKIELQAVATKMFDRIDRDHDGMATAAELEASRRVPGEEPRDRRKGEHPKGEGGPKGEKQ